MNKSKTLTLWLSQVTTKHRRSIQKCEIEMIGAEGKAIVLELNEDLLLQDVSWDVSHNQSYTLASIISHRNNTCDILCCPFVHASVAKGYHGCGNLFLWSDRFGNLICVNKTIQSKRSHRRAATDLMVTGLIQKLGKRNDVLCVSARRRRAPLLRWRFHRLQ
jgi:hypothetical protein